MSTSITVSDLAERIRHDSKLRVIDVRSPGEYSAGHVPGSINIPLEEIEGRMEDLSDGPVAVLCQSGRRAEIACGFLNELRHDILVVQGGTNAWKEADRPMVSSTRTRWSLERQVRLAAGAIVLVATILAVSVNPAWAYLAMFVGAGLTFAGLTDICGMGILFAKMPWNAPVRPRTVTEQEVQA